MSLIEKVILGVDPGTVVMGYSIVHIIKGEVKPITLDVLKFNPKLDHYTRLASIFNELSKVVELYKPDEMALEAPFFGKNVQSMLKLGRAQGVCMATALSKQIPVFEYSPRLIKQSIVGNGNASKEQVSSMLQAMYPGVEHKYLDASDALAVAICHHHQNSGVPSPKHGTGKKTSSKGKSAGWSTFIQQNPERLK
ncbi:MAG: crossover junction endodeoxyribonuclease RuvC [Flavobacteriales bacterium]|jgi:crossover junction endodeoxyribonuclease RuvC|tara:strand:- start:179 stop:763 length:585 start_codon:yes stop_codon:yes gene_type:complete